MIFHHVLLQYTSRFIGVYLNYTYEGPLTAIVALILGRTLCG